MLIDGGSRGPHTTLAGALEVHEGEEGAAAARQDPRQAGAP